MAFFCYEKYKVNNVSLKINHNIIYTKDKLK